MIRWQTAGNHKITVTTGCPGGFGELSTTHCLDVIVAAHQLAPPMTLGGSGTCLETINLNVLSDAGSSGLTYKWYTTALGGSSFYTGYTYSATFPETTTYYVSASDGVTESDRSAVTATVTSCPSTLICDNWISGQTTILSSELNQEKTYHAGSFSCTRGSFYSWSIQGGQIISGDGSASVVVKWNTSGIQRLTVTPSCLGLQHNSHCLEVMVGDVVSAPTMTNGEGTCDLTELITLQVANPNPNLTYQWYTTALGGNSFFQGSAYMATFSATTTYYVSSTNGVQESTRTPVTATVKDLPTAPTAVLPYGFLCSGATQMQYIVDGYPLGHQAEWYNANGDHLFSGEIFTIDISQLEPRYFVAFSHPDFECESERLEFQTGNVSAPVVTLIPHGAKGNQILSESADFTVIAQTDPPSSGEYMHYWGKNAISSNLSTVPQVLQNGEQIELYAYENGCWSEPVVYTAVAASNPDMNWLLAKSFDQNGNVIAESKTYFDYTGKPLQTQNKRFLENKTEVFALQPIYDSYGRMAINTMAAPINSDRFIYQPNFATVNGEPLVERNFDLPLDNTQRGTLGWYYSHNNDLEELTPVSGYPYSRTTYYEDGSTEVKSEAGPGDTTRIGSGHEVFSRSFPLHQELDHYLTVREMVFPDEPIVSDLTYQGGKLISKDANGKEAVSFIDLGGNILASGLIQDDIGAYQANVAIAVGLPDIYYKNITLNASSVTLKMLSNADVQIYDQLQWDESGTNMQAGLLFTGLFYEGQTLDFTPSQDASGMIQIQVRSFNPFAIAALIADNFEECDDPWCQEAKSEGGNPVTDVFIPSLESPTTLNLQAGLYTNFTLQFENVLTGLVVNQSVNNTGLLNLTGGYYKVSFIHNGLPVNNLNHIPPRSTYDQEVATVSYSYPISQLTYRFYDNRGAMVCSISPKGLKDLRSGAATYAEIDKTIYEYSTSGELLNETTIDGGTTNFIYRKDGNVRFSQDAYQKSKGYFSYSAYDEYGRVFSSGEYRGASKVFEPYNSTGYVTNSIHHVVELQGESGSNISGLDKASCREISNIVYDQAVAGSGRTQEFVESSVSYIEYLDTYSSAPTHKTWYSYDIEGRATWVVHEYTDLGKKTFDYEYDYYGNITQVIYQKDHPTEAFYHRYTYDKESRLNLVETSRDGIVWEKQSSFEYYLHGLLKRVVIGDDMQGLDFTYTIKGWLKSVNNVEDETDRKDLLLASGLPEDLFSMQLEYFSGDYVSARTSNTVNDVTVVGYDNQYDGNIKAMTWKSSNPGQPSFEAMADMFAYQYDEVDQLKGADFGSLQSNTFVKSTGNRYQVSNIHYDWNGNILGLRRNGKDGQAVDNFDYQYKGRTNQLMKVGEPADAIYAEYTYDETGRLTTEINHRDSKQLELVYNSLGLVREVKDQGVLLATYDYDNLGQRLKKTVYLAGVTTTTWYVRDANGTVASVYEQKGTAELIQKEIPIYAPSRLANMRYDEDLGWETLYELKDHLGNVRVTFREGKASSTDYFTSMDDGTNINGLPAQSGDPQFQNMTLDWTQSHDQGGASVKLNNQEGPHIWLPVKQGDHLFAEVYFYAPDPPSGGRIGRTTNGFNLPLISAQPTYAGQGEQRSTKTPTVGLNVLAIPRLLGTKTQRTTTSQLTYNAWIRMELYASENGHELIDTRAVQVSITETQAGQWVPISASWDNVHWAEEWCEGFVKIYLDNASNQDLWFDDFNIVQSHLAAPVEVVSYADYYPFGAEMRSSCLTDMRYGYQGDFAEKDQETGWNAFELRMYDARIGRWLSMDPYAQYYSPYMAMGNNPITHVDPDGGTDGSETGREFYIQNGTAVHTGYNNLNHDRLHFVDGSIENRMFALNIVAYETTQAEVFWTNFHHSRDEWAPLMELMSHLITLPMDFASLGSISLGKQALIQTAKHTVKNAGNIATRGKATLQSIKGVTKLKPKPIGCFVAGTLVLTKEGLKAIEWITADELVWAYNTDTGEKELRPVVQAFVKQVDKMVRVYAQGEWIETTPEHPFFVQGSWVFANDLTIGDSLLLFNGKKLVVEQLEKLDTVITVYNFEVKELHDYFVGENEVLVHNSNPCTATSLVKQSDSILKEAQKLSYAESGQVNGLLEQLYKGNWKHAGRGSHDIVLKSGERIIEMRSGGTARVYMRRVAQTAFEILGYSGKNNQNRVIKLIDSFFYGAK
ncbi:MAG: polymorphic toxin-type HINT domain-containing protein [Flammeovirgaceae bacterium]